jgi:hypothetical protein
MRKLLLRGQAQGMSARMRQCTSTADVPLDLLLFAVLAGQKRVSDGELDYAPRTVRCELGRWHEGEHADWVWDWSDKPKEALWARWTAEGPMRFESLPWCETPSRPDKGDVCGLYQDHAEKHSWDVFAPEIEAIRRQVIADNPGWFNPPSA